MTELDDYLNIMQKSPELTGIDLPNLDVMYQPITSLPLTSHQIKRLQKYGIYTIGQLSATSVRELRVHAYWVGAQTIEHAQQALAAYELCLSPDPRDPL